MVTSNQATRLYNGYVRYPWHMIILTAVRRLLKYVLIAVLVSFLTYMFAIATTVSRYVYVYDYGYVYTITPRSDDLGRGTRIVYDPSKTASDASSVDSVTGRLMLATLPPSDISMAVIRNGPNGKMTRSDDGMIFIAGHKTGLTMDYETYRTHRYLEDEYIVQCTGGGCKKGEYTIIPQSAIDGVQVKKER